MHFGLNDPIQLNDPMGLCQGCSTWDDVLRVLKEDPSKLQAGVYVKGKDGSFVHAEGKVIEGVTVTPNGNYRDSERNRFEHIQIITNGWGPLRTAYEIQGGENQPLTAAEYIDYVGPDNEAAARMMTFTAFMWPGAPGGGAAAPRGWNPPMARVGQVKAGAYSTPKTGTGTTGTGGQNAGNGAQSTKGAQLKTYSGTEKAWSSGATPNSIYTYLSSDGKAVSNYIYNAEGKVIYQVDFGKHGKFFSGHGHSMTIPGNLGNGHTSHIPWTTVPSSYHAVPPGVKYSTPIGQ
jgi:hypothetical protein